MGVLAKAHEPRCKLCRSPHRAFFDHLLEQRSDGGHDKDGKRINFAYVQAVYAEKHDGAKLTEDNTRNHWGKHCERITDQEAVVLAEKEAASNNAKAAIFERVLGEGWRERKKTPDEYLEVLREIAFVELYDKAESGAPMGVSVDHALKGIDSSTRRKQEETTAALMRQLVAGVGMAVIDRATQAKQLSAADDEDIIEGEIVNEEEASGAERSQSD